uniref:CUB domain-containing protein n=1 Tax=Branchiostoma floridae TaxID=7739 RepID=C3YFM7_BRAFL|eukprot:XP_002604980.1 hypothetical protein BRAFLDRAFT_92623 [Branchiostoma floridae]
MECPVCLGANTRVERFHCPKSHDNRNATEHNTHIENFMACGEESVDVADQWNARWTIAVNEGVFGSGCINMKFDRIPTFHFCTTLFPIIILSLLMCITFVLPIEKGDRLSFGMTILLSMVVSLVFITEVLPAKGSMPAVALLIVVYMCMMGFFLIVTVIVIRISSKDKDLPPILKKMFLRYVARLVLLGDLTKPTQGHTVLKVDDFEMAKGMMGNDSKSSQAEPSHLLEVLLSLKESVNNLSNAVETFGTCKTSEATEDEPAKTDYSKLARVLDRLCLILLGRMARLRIEAFFVILPLFVAFTCGQRSATSPPSAGGATAPPAQFVVLQAERDREGYLTSLGFPENYPNRSNITWRIEAGNGDVVHLAFDQFDLERRQVLNRKCTWDYVAVYDGTNNLKDKLCGKELPPEVSSSTVLSVAFVSDATVSRSGFSARYWASEAEGVIMHVESHLLSVHSEIVSVVTDIPDEFYNYCKDLDYDTVATPNFYDHYGRISPVQNFYEVGKEVFISCNVGYVIEDGDMSITCEEDGTWSKYDLQCTVDYRQKLVSTKLAKERYFPKLPPSTTVEVFFEAAVVEIIDADEKNENMFASIAFRLQWKDNRLTWDPTLYGEERRLVVTTKDVWIPKVFLQRKSLSLIALKDSNLTAADYVVYFSADARFSDFPEAPVTVTNDGLVEWDIIDLLTTTCDLKSALFPFDTMECPVCLGAITRVESFHCAENGTSTERNTHVEDFKACGDPESVGEADQWNARWMVTVDEGEFGSGCINMTFYRIPTFHFCTTLFPIIILSLLMCITFVLPIEKDKDLPPFVKKVFLRYVARLVLLGDMTKPTQGHTVLKVDDFEMAPTSMPGNNR